MTTPTTQPMEALKPWRYQINYGPNNEDDFANVYNDKGEMVGNLRTQHAMRIVEGMNTRPATDGLREALEKIASSRTSDEMRSQINSEVAQYGDAASGLMHSGLADFERHYDDIVMEARSILKTATPQAEAAPVLPEITELFGMPFSYWNDIHNVLLTAGVDSPKELALRLSGERVRVNIETATKATPDAVECAREINRDVLASDYVLDDMEMNHAAEIIQRHTSAAVAEARVKALEEAKAATSKVWGEATSWYDQKKIESAIDALKGKTEGGV